MAEFNLVGSPEPFLHVSMKQGEAIYCESDAMVMVEQNLEVGGKLRGGIFLLLCVNSLLGNPCFNSKLKQSRVQESVYYHQIWMVICRFLR